MVVPAAPLADDMAAESPHLGTFQEDHDHQGEEDDYGLFDLEEDGPTTAAASNPSSNTNSPGSTGSRVADGASASAATTPTPTMGTQLLLARRYSRTDSSSNLLLMKRVGSTFFSVAGSVASDLDMLDFSSHHHGTSLDGNTRPTLSFETAATPPAAVEVSCSMSDILYHDIMLNIFAHMTATELAAFSETAHRPNVDVHNYLRLQLERALLLDPTAGNGDSNNTTDDDDEENHQSDRNDASATPSGGRRSSFLTTTVELGVDGSSGTSPITRRASFHRHVSSSTCPIAVCGAGILSRLATLDRAKAERFVEDYRTISESSATTASSAAYKGGHRLFGTSPAMRADAAMRELQARMVNHKGAAAGAVVFTVMGAAANKLMTEGGLHMPAEAQQAATAFTLGCAGLGLVATRYGRLEGDGNAVMSDGAHSDAQDGAAANMARRVQALLMRMPHPEEGGIFPMAIIERMSTVAPMPSQTSTSPPSPNSARRGKRAKRQASLDAVDQYQDSKVDSSDDAEDDEEDDYKSVVSSMEGLNMSINAVTFPPVRRRPTGCLGAYARILRRAAEAVTEHVRSQRKEAFARLSEEERAEATTAFIDACSSDANLEVVEDLVRNAGVDIDGFYVGSDGTTETCGLHTAAFNDATEVLKFLCSGIDERDPAKDGGLCDIDVVDSNKWSALHFAAGADSAAGVRVLASFGAKMSVEAANGYTPYHWAERLSNSEAAEELKRLGADDRFVFSNQMPFAFFASRFFALMPVAAH